MHLPSDIVNINEKPNQYELEEVNVREHAMRIKNEEHGNKFDKIKTVQNMPNIKKPYTVRSDALYELCSTL